MIDLRTAVQRFSQVNAALAASYLLALVTSVVLARSLDTSAFGMLAFAGAVASYTGLLGRWGVETNLVRDLVSAGEAGRGETFRVASALHWRVGVPAVAVAAAISLLFFPALKAMVVAVVAVAGFVAVFDPGALYDIAGRTPRHAFLSTSRQAAYALAVLAVVAAVRPPITVVGVALVGVAANLAFVAFCAGELGLPARAFAPIAPAPAVGAMLRRNGAAVAALLAHQVYVNADTVLISTILGDRALAPYAVASSLALAGLGSVAVFHRLFNPGLGQAIRDGDGAATYRRSLLYTTIGAVAGGALLTLAAPLAVHWFYPPTLADAARLVRPFGLWILCAGPGGLAAYALLATGRDRRYFVSVLTGAVLNLALNAVLIPRFGPWGAAWVTVVSQAAASGLALLSTRDLLRGRGGGDP